MVIVVYGQALLRVQITSPKTYGWQARHISTASKPTKPSSLTRKTQFLSPERAESLRFDVRRVGEWLV